MRRTWVAFLVAIAAILIGLHPAKAQDRGAAFSRSPRVILSFGTDQFIPKAAVEAATGARIQSAFSGLRFLDQVSVIILADIPHAQVLPVLQTRLADWVRLGGGLLFTGGHNSFGLGGYVDTSIGTILPLRPDSRDQIAHRFGQSLIYARSHPVLGGVTFASMGNFNETQLAGDATLLVEYRAGSAVFGGAVSFGTPPWPLLAERRLGAGLVLATALDMNATGEWKDRDTFVANLIRYLLDQSRLPRPQ